MKNAMGLCLVSAMVGGVTATVLTGWLRPAATWETQAWAQRRPTVAGEAPLDAQLRLTETERTHVAVYERCNRSVVHITTRATRVDPFFLAESPAEGSGSGSVLDREGHILTNYHVIDGADKIRVTMFDGQEWDAELVGQDPVNDIAVLRIPAPAQGLVPLVRGDSQQLRVGQFVYAIGNPFGLERTMTVGIVSSLNRILPTRQRRTIKSVIQIDAALNRGNSGGPLLNSRGELIGMNTAIASSTGENTGVGFAIPASTIARVVPQLIEDGRVIRPEIGIADMLPRDGGLAIKAVVPGGPAARAGLRGYKIVEEQSRQGPYIIFTRRLDKEHADVILAVDQQRVRTVDEFLTAIEQRRPGDTVVLDVVRDRQRIRVPVVLGESR